LHTIATQSSERATSNQPSHSVSSNSPRGNSGRAARAACSDSGRNEVSSGGTASPAQIRAAYCATTSPVSRSRPGVGLISMFRKWRLARQKRAAFSKVGSGSPAWARECQLPASSRASCSQGWSPARPMPLVVRSSVASCSRKGTPSADSFTSHSNMR
jgi:hypothetical protein